MKYFAIANAISFFSQNPYSSVFAISDYSEFQILKWIKIFSILLKLSSQVQNPFKAFLNTLASFENNARHTDLMRNIPESQITRIVTDYEILHETYHELFCQ